MDMKTRAIFFAAILAAHAGTQIGLGATGTFAERMTAMPDSILQVDPATGRFLGRNGLASPLAGLVTQAAVDQSAPVKFHVALKMRNLPELRERLARGEVLSQAEMTARYYPLVEDWQAVADWLTSHGLVVVPENPKAPLHLGVVAHGALATVSRTLAVEFVAVQGADGKIYSSAVTPPNVPTRLDGKLIGITGLQPHLRPLPQQVTIPATPESEAFQSGGFPFNPPQYYPTIGPLALLNFYHGLTTAHGGTNPFDGTGQTIAIMMTQDDVTMLQSDLALFWASIHSSHTLADLTVINPGWYAPVVGKNASNNQVDFEATIDVEWSSGMAEGAKIRLYESLNPEDFVPKIISDKATIPGLNQASGSFGFTEFGVTENGTITPAVEQGYSQYFASLIAAGVTYFAPTGDYGSNPNTNDDGPGYPTWPISVLYPACDPAVVAVGGTNMYCPDTGVKNPTGEGDVYDSLSPLRCRTQCPRGHLGAWQLHVLFP